MVNNTRPIFGAVLAGGRSSRMGRDKRFLLSDGETWVDRAVRLMTEAVGGDAARVILCGDVPGRRCLMDQTSGLGPLAGVLSVMRWVRAQGFDGAWINVIPVDMPHLNLALLEPLIRATQNVRDPGVRFLSYSGFEMPFAISCKSVSETTVSQLCRSAAPSDRSIRALKRLLPHLEIAVPCFAEDGFLNANFPQEVPQASFGGSDETQSR